MVKIHIYWSKKIVLRIVCMCALFPGNLPTDQVYKLHFN